MGDKHDRRYKRLFSNPEAVEELVTSFVDLDIVHEFDYSTLEKVPKEFTTGKYKKRESDLIYKVNHKGRDAYIFILIEFQSRVDYKMPLRMAAYTSLFYLSLKDIDEFCRKRELPVLLPIVLYNGESEWNAALSIEEMIPAQGNIRAYIPKFCYYLIAENTYSKETLIGISNAVSAIFLLENSNKDSIEENLRIVVELIQQKDPKLIKLIEGWVVNCLEDTGDYTEVIHKSFTKAKGVDSMLETTMKQIKEEGIEKGREEGREEGVYKVAINMIKKGMDDATIQDVTDLSSKKIKELRKQGD